MAYTDKHKQKEMIKIFAYMADGQSIAQAIDNKDITCGQRTFWTWLSDSYDFKQDYARAEVERGLFLFEETMLIADDDESCKYLNTKTGAIMFDSAAVRNKEVKINNRRWFLSKFLPRKYADKLQIDITTDTKPQGFDVSLLKPDTLALIERDLLNNKTLTNSIPAGDIQEAKILE